MSFSSRVAPQVVEEAFTPTYPALEAFIETVPREEAVALYTELEKKLGALPAMRAEQVKKVRTAITQTQELIGILLDTRERLAAEMKGSK